MITGVNKGAGWQNIQKAITDAEHPGRMLAYRGYNTPGEGVPVTWPGPSAKPIPDGWVTPLISIRPDVPSVISGLLDKQLAAYFKQVPRYARVTCWAEGEGDRFSFTPQELKAMHERVDQIFNNNAPITAQYGQVFGSYVALNPKASHYPLGQWLYQDLDFYAVDYYKGNEDVMGDLENIRDTVEANTDFPRLDVWECNCVSAKYRPEFFRNMWRACSERLDSSIMCMYFDAPNNLPVSIKNLPWNPDDKETIGVIQDMVAAQIDGPCL